MIDAYVGLGGNVGDVPARIDEAVERMRAWPCVRAARRSPLYRTAPVGPVRDQPAFVNAVAHLAVVGVTARELWGRLAALERALGRTRGAPQGPREIDLDLLLFGRDRTDDPDLTLPHPRAHERAFVLVPLADVGGDALVLAGRPIREWLATEAVKAQDIAPWVC